MKALCKYKLNITRFTVVSLLQSYCTEVNYVLQMLMILCQAPVNYCNTTPPFCQKTMGTEFKMKRKLQILTVGRKPRLIQS